MRLLPENQRLRIRGWPTAISTVLTSSIYSLLSFPSLFFFSVLVLHYCIIVYQTTIILEFTAPDNYPRLSTTSGDTSLGVFRNKTAWKSVCFGLVSGAFSFPLRASCVTRSPPRILEDRFVFISHLHNTQSIFPSLPPHEWNLWHLL